MMHGTTNIKFNRILFLSVGRRIRSFGEVRYVNKHGGQPHMENT